MVSRDAGQPLLSGADTQPTTYHQINMGHHDTLPSAIRHAMHYAAAAIDCCSARKSEAKKRAGHHHSLKNIYASKGLDPRLVQRAVTSIGFERWRTSPTYSTTRALARSAHPRRELPSRSFNRQYRNKYHRRKSSNCSQYIMKNNSCKA